MLKTKLYEHQEYAYEYSKTHKKFLLADEMGAGKTLEVINIALQNKKPGTHCLIICGVNGLKYNWYEEIQRHTDEKAHILGQRMTRNGIRIRKNEDKLDDLYYIDDLPYFIITNIESLRYKIKTGKKLRHGKKMVEEEIYKITDRIVELCEMGIITMIACDEVHKCKNCLSEQGKQLLRLNADRMIAMTGTPIMNSPLDLYTPLHWLGYEDHSFFQFKMHYCHLGGYGGHEVVGYKNTQQLQAVLDKMMLRRLKKDLLDLPPKVYIDEYVEMTDSQTRVYQDVFRQVKKEIDLIVSSPNPLARLIRLRQATGYPGILSSKATDSGKLYRIEDLVEDIVTSGEKVVIFSNWTQMTDILYKRLLRFSPLLLTGETPDSLRTDIKNEFQFNPNSRVIIGTYGALGTGFTLTAASNIITFDQPWTMAAYEQAIDRCHRIGQGETLTVYNLITKNTIDERVWQLVKEKGDLSDAIVDKKEVVSFLLS